MCDGFARDHRINIGSRNMQIYWQNLWHKMNQRLAIRLLLSVAYVLQQLLGF